MGVMTSRPPLADGSLLWRETTTVTYLEPLALSASCPPALRLYHPARWAFRTVAQSEL